MKSKLVMLLPKIESMITGVKTIEINKDATCSLVYVDGNRETGTLPAWLMSNIILWGKIQKGKLKMDLPKLDTFSIVSQIQSQRVKDL